jgi:hypothetical protein
MMSDTVDTKLSGKMLFGIDYLNIMFFTQWNNEHEKYDETRRGIVEIVSKMFLLKWGFSLAEIDGANKAFWEKNNSEKTNQYSIDTVIDRIVDFIKDDKNAQERFLIEVSAVSHIEEKIQEKERYIIDKLQSKFDFRPSEIDEFFQKGWQWKTALDILGDNYIEAAKAKQKQVDDRHFS